MNGKALNILILEDNDTDARAVQQHLIKGFSATVTRVKTLREGCHLASEKNYDAALLNLNLPDSSPEMTFQTFSKYNPLIPVIVIASHYDEELAKKLLNEGAQDYLAKGKLAEDYIVRAVRYSIERKSLQRKLKSYAVELEMKNKRLEKVISIRTEKLTKSEKKYKFLVKNAPLGIIVINQSGRVGLVNPEFYSIFGYSDTDRLNSIFELIPKKSKNAVSEIKRVILSSNEKPYKTQLHMKKKSGELVWVQMNISAIVSDPIKEKQFLILLDDCSDLKKQEEIEKQKKIAEQANQAKTEFLTNISHEIKTPLTAIVGFIDLISHKNKDPSLNHYLDSIQRNSKHLLFLVKGLLDLSKIESGQLESHLEHFSLIEEINSIKNMMQPLIVEKPVSLQIKYHGLIPREVVSDLQKFRQIVINVLTNSIKYTDIGTITLLVKIKYEGRKDVGKLVLRISDSGMGMSSQHQQQLFLPFVRSNQKEVIEREGIGVGLSISKKLAVFLGGDIRLIRSELGKGTEFEVTLPVGNFSNTAFYRPDSLLAIEKCENEKKESEVRFWLKGRRVLIVDDVDDLQFLTEKILTQVGAQVEIAGNGQLAIDKMKSKNYDLVLMDLQMPVKDGFQAIKEVRAMGYSGNVIALTAHAFLSEQQKCLKSGFNGFIQKPFSRGELLKKVGRYIVDEHKGSIQAQKIAQPQRSDEDIYNLFKHNFKTALKDIRSFITSEDQEGVRKVAHKLKGSSGCYGYRQASNYAAELECLCMQPNGCDWNQAQLVFKKLEDEAKKSGL